MRVIIMGAGDRPGVLDAFGRLKPELEKHVDIVETDFNWTKDITNVEADIVIVFGGDGSVLRSVNKMQYRQLPVLAVNFGTLGFHSNFHVENLIETLEELNNLGPNNLPIKKHLMLKCEIKRKKHNDVPQVEEKCLCLNEVITLSGEGLFSIVNIALSVDSLPVTTFRCDGLIISTPVGSTGHNLSAGGPILRKDIDAVVITPINPHALSYRPVVDSADRTYELNVVEKVGSVLVDGALLTSVGPEDRIIVSRAEVVFKKIETPGHEFYTTLRDKLGWSGRIK
ncbi:MAG: NAD(+)/NADH kinase [Thermoguttaceae bacterium]